MKFFAVLCCLGLGFIVQPHFSHAQSPTVQVFCDADEFSNPLPDPLPGTVFNVLRPNETRTDYQLRRTTQNSTETTTIPVPPELIGKLTYSDVSPDGRYVTLIPYGIDGALVVWKIDTNELAIFPLSLSDREYLDAEPYPIQRFIQELDWLDNQRMVLRYFDLEYPWFDYLIAQKVFTVIDEPFQIIEGERVDIPVLPLDAPIGDTYIAPVFSPQGNYVTVASRHTTEDFTYGSRFQIYDVNTLQMVAEFESHADRGLSRIPLWTFDENYLFLDFTLKNNPPLGETQLIQVNVGQGFQEGFDLFATLEEFFGQKVSYSMPTNPHILSPSGNILVIHVHAHENDQDYVVAYSLVTGEIRVICDDGFPDPQTNYPVWSPDERYFGYWGGGIRLFDLTNGQRYGIDGEGFVGWVDSATSTSP